MGDARDVELTRSGIVATLAVLAVVALCLRLGFWQLDRRDQRLERNAAVAERMTATPVGLLAAPTDTAGLIYRSATASGTYDHDRTIILGARSMNGIPGVHVLTPLRTADGAILVNRGWVPSADAATVDLALVSRPPGGEIAGVLVPFPDVRLPRDPDGFRTRWFRLDGDAIRAQYPYRVAPLYLQTTGDPQVAPTAGVLSPQPLAPPTLDAGPHLSYAVQWFSFAAIFLIGWATLVLRRHARPTTAR
jgi:surfeit locus 1 family protein